MVARWLLTLGFLLALQATVAGTGQNNGGGQHEVTNPSPTPNSKLTAGRHYYCRIPEMPVSWGTPGHPVELVRSDAVFTELGTAIPGLHVRNTSELPITNLAFVVEYFDGQGHKATTAAIAAAAAGYEKSMRLPFSVENTESWKVPLKPGATGRVSGFYDSVRTTTCPEAGRVTFVIARFMNGSVQQYAADGWSVPPLPRLVPELTAPCPAVEKNPTQIRAKLRLAASGDVVGISATALTKDDADRIAWITTQMKQWKFHPALLDGKPHEDELEVEFVLYGVTEPDFAAISLATPATLVVFSPRKNVGGGCVESFGFLGETTTIP